MKKIIIILSTLTVLFFSCADKNTPQLNEGFIILGNIKNIPDSSWVTLSNNNSGIIDSTMVLNNKFELTGKVETPTNYFLLIKSTMDYKSIWVENSKMTFTAESGKFFEAKVTGSKTQLDADKLWVKLLPLYKKQDSLSLLIRKGNNKTSLKAESKKIRITINKMSVDFIRENPNSLISLHNLEIMKTTYGKELTDTLYSKFSNEFKISKKGKSIHKYIRINKNPKVGDKYIDFTLKNSNGKDISLSDIKAKIILLNFWSSYCGPCRYENKNLVKIYKEFKSKGFEIVGVAEDKNKEKWLKAIKDDKLVWENLIDDNEAFLIYGINSTPDNFLINGVGVIIGRNLRGDELNKELNRVLN
ncbi:MAG: AhpC/TSA family protein [Melioribacteraceae bacterium]|nr:AhpC/TSA family protein [Melioribacteraceae bacterium]